MRKMFVILAIVMMLAGCASVRSFLCTNGPTVTDGLQMVINQANSVISAIQTTYPNIIPESAQEVLATAQMAKDAAQAALSKVCPAPAELTVAQEKMSEAMKQLNLSVMKGTMKLGR